jgi:signal transduction histidine kinase
MASMPSGRAVTRRWAVLRDAIRTQLWPLPGVSIVVAITDSGVGMSPEVQANTVRAFYTTKDVGNGTSLGLDISRQIVSDRHGGELTIDSERAEQPCGFAYPAMPAPTEGRAAQG